MREPQQQPGSDRGVDEMPTHSFATVSFLVYAVLCLAQNSSWRGSKKMFSPCREEDGVVELISRSHVSGMHADDLASSGAPSGFGEYKHFEG